MPAVQVINNSLLVKQSEYKLGGHTEENTIYEWFSKDSFTNYKGMLHIWNQRGLCNTPLLNMTDLKDNVIYVNGPNGEWSYSVPYQLGLPYIVENLIPGDVTPGQGQVKFKIKLSENCFTNTDRITYDYRNGKQLFITEEDEIYEENGGYVYTVYLVTNDPADFFPPSKLAPGTKFMKISNSNGEFSTNKSKIFSRAGAMKLKNQLAGHRSVYHWITGYADMMNVSISDDNLGLSAMYGDLTKDNAILEIANLEQDPSTGKLRPVKGTGKWIGMIEAMLFAEMKNMEEKDIMWSQGGMVYGAGRTPIKVGTGLYQQLKAGNRIKVNKYTKSVLDQAFGKLYAGSKVPLTERRTQVQCGMAALIEVSKLIENDFKSLPFNVNIGKDSGLNILSGDRNNLNFQYRFTSMQFPVAGILEFVHNPAFDNYDHRDADVLIGDFPAQSYTMAVFDITDSRVSNAASKMETGHRAGKGFSEGSNIVLVRPEGEEGIAWSHEIGTRNAKGSQKGFVGSSQRHGYAISMQSFSGIWLKDATRSLMIELNTSGMI